MNCKAFSDLLDAYLAGEAPRDQAKEMQAHAASCPDCALRLRMLEDSRRLDAETPVPEDFSAAWRQAVAEEKAASKVVSFRAHARRYLSAAAALVLVAGGALLAWRNRPALQQQPVPTAEKAAVYSAAGIAPAGTAMPTRLPVLATSMPVMNANASAPAYERSEAEEAVQAEAEEAVWFEDALAAQASALWDEAAELDAGEEYAAEEYAAEGYAAAKEAAYEQAADAAIRKAQGKDAYLVIFTKDQEADRAALEQLTASMGGTAEDAPDDPADGDLATLLCFLPWDQWTAFLEEAQKLGVSAEPVDGAFAVNDANEENSRVQIRVILRRAE